MPTIATAEYLGDLRISTTHTPSGDSIFTDAPKDNGGQGRHFSPTDLCAASLAYCGMSIMGLYAKNHNVNIDGARMEISKTMSAEPPRRIAEIAITVTMPDRDYSEKEKKSLERCVHTCPVRLSLHPDVKQIFTFNWAR